MGIRDEVITDQYAIYNGDCCEFMEGMPDNSVDFSVYSPPFGGLYHYSSDPRDISNCIDYKEFFEHYGYVIDQKARVTKPGRLTAVHCCDVALGNTGKDALMDLSGDIIKRHSKAGWVFVARHAIWKEPLWVRNRTMVKNLSHRTCVDDSAYAGVASCEFLLVFRNDGANQIPIAHPTGFERYAGECDMPSDILKYKNWDGDQKQNRYSHWIWRRYASGIWDDIRMSHVLPYRECKEEEDEKHVHPLQLDVIERAIELRSNPGEVVFTPFMGVGSEVFVAVETGRKGIGVELKPSYFNQAKRNLQEARPYIDDDPDMFRDYAEIDIDTDRDFM